jgi:hypothetical protein
LDGGQAGKEDDLMFKSLSTALSLRAIERVVGMNRIGALPNMLLTVMAKWVAQPKIFPLGVALLVRRLTVATLQRNDIMHMRTAIPQGHVKKLKTTKKARGNNL